MNLYWVQGTWRKLKLPFKFGNKKIEPSDLRLRLDVSVRDNKI